MKRIHFYRIMLLFLLPAVFSMFRVQAQSGHITPEMIADMKYVREVTISPDGQTVAYGIRIPGSKQDKPGKSYSELWTIPFDKGSPRQYIGKPYSAWSFQWEPGGKNIYFLSRRKKVDRHTQIYSIPVDGGQPKPVTRYRNSISSYRTSPDGNLIAFTSKDPKTKEEIKQAKKGKDWIVPDKNYKYKRLYLYNRDKDTITQIFTRDLNVTSFVWGPDNETIVFQATETPKTDHTYMYKKIYKVDIKEGDPEVLCKTEGKLGDMEISPNGDKLAFAGAVDIYDPLSQSLFIVSMKKGEPKNISKDYEGSLTNVDWQDKDHLLVRTVEGVYSTIYLVEVDNNEWEQLYDEDAILWSVSYDPGTGNTAMTGHTPEHPTELFTGRILKNDFERRTHINPPIEDTRLAKQEVTEWKGPGDWTIQGVLTYPLNYEKGKQYPLLLQIHGGPEGVSSNGWTTWSVYPVQWYAANGYFVLQPNYRGSEGRGVKFSKGDQKDLAGKEFQDILKGIDHLVNEGKVDPNRVATGGFSYGGYLSAWAATKHSERFKAALVGAGISNWISFSGTTDIIHENSLVHWHLWWYDHMDLVWDRSPLAHINNAQTPTLVVHGNKDERVPISQGYELYNALKLKEVPTQMVIYKRQPHGIRERAAKINFINRSLEWFDKYTKDSSQ